MKFNEFSVNYRSDPRIFAGHCLTYLAINGVTLNYMRFAKLMGISTQGGGRGWIKGVQWILDSSDLVDLEGGNVFRRSATIVLQHTKLPSIGFWRKNFDGMQSREFHLELLSQLTKYSWKSPDLNAKQVAKIDDFIIEHLEASQASGDVRGIA